MFGKVSDQFVAILERHRLVRAHGMLHISIEEFEKEPLMVRIREVGSPQFDGQRTIRPFGVVRTQSLSTSSHDETARLVAAPLLCGTDAPYRSIRSPLPRRLWFFS